MLSLDAFSGVERVDAAAGTAVVGAGTRLGTLARELARHGLALANLGDIDRQTVAGAVATGTHGTGITIGSLSSQIVAMTIVDGTGRVRQLDADRRARCPRRGHVHHAEGAAGAAAARRA
jgi:FAD/FMN-containing dehydrogenase